MREHEKLSQGWGRGQWSFLLACELLEDRLPGLPFTTFPIHVLGSEWWTLRTYLLTVGIDHEAATPFLALQDGPIENREGAFLSLAWKWLDPRDSQGHMVPVTSE